MKLLTFALCVALFAACRAPRPAPLAFPESVGAWKLKQAHEVAASEPIRRLGLKTAKGAEYEGPGKIVAEAYELTSSAAAFEAEQQWRPLADTVAFHRDVYFFVIHWENADRAAVSAFVRELEKQP